MEKNKQFQFENHGKTVENPWKICGKLWKIVKMQKKTKEMKF
jgi:hypothetical protein